MNHKTARIIKLWRKGLTVEQIIKQLGYEGDEVKRRVEQTILQAQSDGDDA